MSAIAQKKADEFLKICQQFQLADLPTESRHSDTKDLARLANEDLQQAFDVFKAVDVAALEAVLDKAPLLEPLRTAIKDTLESGGRIYFYGCGATGRLSLSIGYLWRYLAKDEAQAARVIDFMSGGDLALVHSIENFEDHPEFGARQLRELDFSENDLLVSCTEGGETPSVIGATEEAVRISSRKPFFLYCNPDDVLQKVERSRLVLENNNIEKICLHTGPQALSGSTRLQASTVLMLGAGAALMGVTVEDIKEFIAFFKQAHFSFWEDFTIEESRLYQDGYYILYETNYYGMTIVTDTTERAPTFSLTGFENQNDENRKASLSYFRVPDSQNAHVAWRDILLRDPVSIEWDELKEVAGGERLYGFDFSKDALAQRQALVGTDNLQRFVINRDGDYMTFALGVHKHEINVAGLHPLLEHLFLKMMLNTHSTLLMGRLGRYQSNIMTWVKPSNNKLIDRSIRYIQYLLEHENIHDFSYEDICYQLFADIEIMAADEAIVLKTFQSLKNNCS